MNASPSYQIAIVGAGFCGTMVALNLVTQIPEISLALIERSPIAGRGLAYGTSDPDHLLNVRAEHMGAFVDKPRHFWHWLETHASVFLKTGITPQSFVPRMIYGDYLTTLLGECCATHPSMNVLHRRITHIRRAPEAGFELVADDGYMLTAEYVVLALGNFPPDQLSHPSNFMNPYLSSTWQRLAADGDVLIVGTGLTSLDLVVTLAKTKRNGVLHLLSRHGLLPREHEDPKPHTLKLSKPYPTTALGLYQALRQEITQASAISWQNVIDALRPLNQLLWASLHRDEKRRFLRHLRPYWDVHRHRCAPEIMEAYRKLEKEGRLILHHGSIIKQTACEKGWDISWRPRGLLRYEKFTVQQVVRCTGPQADIAKMDDALVQNLFTEGLIASDDVHLGLALTETYEVLDSAGKEVRGLYALGSLLKGKLYESVAVPELREQAAAIAHHIAQNVKRRQAV